MVFEQQIHAWIFIFLLIHLFKIDTICSETKHKPKIGLVLSGGGAKGLAHIGVLKVLEEVGINVDMVGGTSMGSIVGGMYAIGYSAKEIEHIFLQQDWVYLLTDQFNRNILSVSEKEESDKYIISFPFENLKLQLPSGLGAGQNISMLLSQIAIPVANVNDFSNLPRPFLCIGTDIVTGEEVLLNKGYLPDAIRASMAIPTIFTPVEIDDRLLVDGGLVNNFPVDRVKEMGADILIGVNLGLKDYTKDELKNLATVLEQSIFFQAKERNKANQLLCDILIEPDVYSNTAASFMNTDSLIKIGEDAARAMLPELKHLADSLKDMPNQHIIDSVNLIDSIYIENIQINDLNYVTGEFIEGKLRLNTPGMIAVKDLNNGIERVYGTQFFHKITYKIDYQENKHAKLILRAEESKSDLLRLGARYDSQYKTQLLLNTTFRNKFIKGTKFTIDLQLGEYPRFKTEFKLYTGWKPRKNPVILKNKKMGLLPDIGIRFDARTFDVFYYENSELQATYDYSYFNFNLHASTNISNSVYFEFGSDADLTNFNPQVAINPVTLYNQFVLPYGYFKIDTRNKNAFFTKGSLFMARAEGIYDMRFNRYKFTPVYRWFVKGEKAINIGKKVCIIPGIQTGMAYGDSIPVEYRFYLGGSSQFGNGPSGIFQFNGLRFMEEWDQSAVVASLKIQYEFATDNFIAFDGNVGKVSNYWEKIFFDTENILSGYGLRYGYSSLIGPFEFGLYKAGHRKSQWVGYINVGYYF